MEDKINQIQSAGNTNIDLSIKICFRVSFAAGTRADNQINTNISDNLVCDELPI